MKKLQQILHSVFLDKVFLKFAIVGVINTLVGTLIMFTLYNLFGVDYWLSTATNLFFTSILSYLLNKRFTFQNKEKNVMFALRFAVNILACYIVAYGCAKPLVSMILGAFAKKIQENVSMLVGMVLFTLLNYFGQRMFVFGKTKKEPQDL